MISATQTIVLLGILCAVHAATIYEKQAAKRAVDSYNYPLPVITFADAGQKKTIVETMKSVSPARYLPPSPTASSATGPKAPPISVSFNAYEAPVAPKPASTAAPVDNTPTPTATPQKKRPSGGLGGFKYYGGSGSTSNNAVAAAPAASTSAPATPSTAKSESSPIPKQASKSQGYDYPSPKSIRKPSKKEQKLADSKPEESAQGYHYDVGPAAIAASSFLSGSSLSGGSSSGAMGLSYMRQSSPFYSYHVMLD